MRVLGIDPGFASLGWGAFFVGLDGRREFMSCGILETAKKEGLRKSTDVALRGEDLFIELHSVFQEVRPNAVFVEGQSWPRDASVSAKMGVAWGIVLACSALNGTRVVQIPPKDLKYRLTGSTSAEKKIVQAAVEKLLPESAKSLARFRSRAEHPADALGAALVGHAMTIRPASLGR